MDIDFEGKTFAGRVRYKDGTYGLTNTMTFDDLLKSLIAYLPIDIIYNVETSPDGIINAVVPIGKIGLSFKIENFSKELFHAESETEHKQESNVGRELRSPSNIEGAEGVDGGAPTTKLDTGRIPRTVSRGDGSERKKRTPKHDVGREQGAEVEGGSVAQLGLLPPDPTEQSIALVKESQKKSPNRAEVTEARVLNEKSSHHGEMPGTVDSKEAENKFQSEFGWFGSTPK